MGTSSGPCLCKGGGREDARGGPAPLVVCSLRGGLGAVVAAALLAERSACSVAWRRASSSKSAKRSSMVLHSGGGSLRGAGFGKVVFFGKVVVVFAKKDVVFVASTFVTSRRGGRGTALGFSYLAPSLTRPSRPRPPRRARAFRCPRSSSADDAVQSAKPASDSRPASRRNGLRPSVDTWPSGVSSHRSSRSQFFTRVMKVRA
mmetsp:Transcript_6271/g.20442  ORF Transcript_6271/g.20442 Transcript_6271/m.20442 type:complete len:203 (+) Transcript_6271:544-1152(+)